MDKSIDGAYPPADALTFPIRRGTRPTTIHGPLHIQVEDNGDDGLLRDLIEEVAAWPGVDARPLPIGSSDLVSLRLDQELAADLEPIFITEREFGRVLFGAPTIYLALPLSCAHWALVRGWAEPHFSSSFGLMPPGVMVIYTPRDEQEKAVCRSLFQRSYAHFVSRLPTKLSATQPCFRPTGPSNAALSCRDSLPERAIPCRNRRPGPFSDAKWLNRH